MRRRVTWFGGRLAAVVVCALAVTGAKCSDEGPIGFGGSQVTATSVAGRWSGALLQATMTLTLTQSGTGVTGTGSVLADESIPLSVTGTSDRGSFSLNISSPEFESMTYVGQVSTSAGTTTMTGTVNGSGFNNQAVTLTKQP